MHLQINLVPARACVDAEGFLARLYRNNSIPLRHGSRHLCFGGYTISLYMCVYVCRQKHSNQPLLGVEHKSSKVCLHNWMLNSSQTYFILSKKFLMHLCEIFNPLKDMDIESSIFLSILCDDCCFSRRFIILPFCMC